MTFKRKILDFLNIKSEEKLEDNESVARVEEQNSVFFTPASDKTSIVAIPDVTISSESSRIKLECFMKENLKFGPIKVFEEDSENVSYSIPRRWRGRLSGVEFGVSSSEEGLCMEMMVPGEFPTPLSLNMNGEEELYEFSRTADLAFSIASRGNNFPRELIVGNEMALSWFCGLMKGSAGVARSHINTLIETLPMAEMANVNLEKMESSARILESIASRLEGVILMYCDKGWHEKMSSQRKSKFLN
jgi:hypothetical protein